MFGSCRRHGDEPRARLAGPRRLLARALHPRAAARRRANARRTALNVHTLCTLNANREAEMGALMFYEYLAACVTVPLFLAFFLHVTQLYFH